MKFTAPSNSRSIRVISSAIRRRSSPMSLITVSTQLVDAQKISLIMDKRRGEVAGLRVERAMGIQGRLEPPSLR